MQLPFLKNLEDFSLKVIIIQSNSGNVQVYVTGHFTKLLIWKINISIHNLYIYTSYPGTLARKAGVIISYPAGR